MKTFVLALVALVPTALAAQVLPPASPDSAASADLGSIPQVDFDATDRLPLPPSTAERALRPPPPPDFKLRVVPPPTDPRLRMRIAQPDDDFDYKMRSWTDERERRDRTSPSQPRSRSRSVPGR